MIERPSLETTTHRQRAEEEETTRLAVEQAARRAAEAASERLASVLESITDGFFALDGRGRFTYVNRRAGEILGRAPADLLGRGVVEIFPGLPPSELYAQAMIALREGTATHVESYFAPLERWFECHFYPSGEALSVYFRDVSARKRADETQRFLARASEVLASSLDYEVTLRTVARLAVPTFADWCIVDVIGDDGEIERLEVAATDPVQENVLRQFQRRHPPSWDSHHPVVAVLRTGQTLLIAHDPADPGRHDPLNADQLHLANVLGHHSTIVVPLVAHGHTVGAMSFGSSREGQAYGPADVGLAEDLARRCALAIDNTRLYRATQDAVRARDEFLSVAAHELKTPVTSLRGFAQLLGRQIDRGEILDPARVRQAAATIDQQSVKLVRLVSQLLDVSRIEAGRLVLDRQVTDIRRVVQSVVAAARVTATGHTFVVRAPRRLDVLLDSLRCEQVVTNLLDNAVKYSPEGSEIAVDVSADRAVARVAVTDRGPGIAPDKLRQIFDRFSQAHAGDRVAGMGLGLYISREIVQLHGGCIEVERPPEGGTRFVVTLPRGTVASAAGRGARR